MSGAGRDGDLLVVADRLWDGAGGGARRDMALAIRGGRVDRVAPVSEWAGWAGPRLHVGGATVMPGLMDLHVHLVSVVDPDEPNAIWAEVGARTQLLTEYPSMSAELLLNTGWFFARPQEKNLFLDGFRAASVPLCASDGDLATITKPTRLPECMKP